MSSSTLPETFANLWSADRGLQNAEFHSVIALTDEPVGWAYDIWDETLANLTHKDNHNRAIAAQVLSNLAKSDPKNRILKDFKQLFEVTRDERFVTARHCLQSLWKVGAAGKKQQKLLLEALDQLFVECLAEKNCTLIRYDILQVMRRLFDTNLDEKIKAKALELLATEQDLKYRKKYATLW